MTFYRQKKSISILFVDNISKSFWVAPAQKLLQAIEPVKLKIMSQFTNEKSNAKHRAGHVRSGLGKLKL